MYHVTYYKESRHSFFQCFSAKNRFPIRIWADISGTLMRSKALKTIKDFLILF